ncbi:Transcription factor MYB3R-3 [Hondaea fermentalgiana]|uniref:Transcription factor MYB3R-3 n=1 Tax=Hondaea fermentalgiana TaxID=2315210 RepID=A0A2R5G1J5_9STRA|nr:Transcription factor MYB3R-3 [Hondaea fermentalgiana]|eukprot:GBG24395.1 Transcription factor MYB3R-3 [Hondaea fermentalgiana]
MGHNAKMEELVQRKLKPSCPRHWSADEDELLRAAVSRFGARHWKTIAAYVPSRSHTQCLQRWNKVLKPGLLKGPWSPEEDHLLRRLVEQSLASIRLTQSDSCDSMHTDMDTDSVGSGGDMNGLSGLARRVDWVLIAENIPGRSVKQCRERWCSNLDPSINKGSWTAQEDSILLSTQASQGNCWAHIARLLPGRTEHAVKTRFRSIQRARRREWSKEEDATLIKQYQTHGSQWALVAEPFQGSRTKNAVMTRFKQLQGLGLVQPSRRSRTVVPRARMTTVQPLSINPSSLTLAPHMSLPRVAADTSQLEAPISTSTGLEASDIAPHMGAPAHSSLVSTAPPPPPSLARIFSLSRSNSAATVAPFSDASAVDLNELTNLPRHALDSSEPGPLMDTNSATNNNQVGRASWTQPRIQDAITKLIDSAGASAPEDDFVASQPLRTQQPQHEPHMNLHAQLDPAQDVQAPLPHDEPLHLSVPEQQQMAVPPPTTQRTSRLRTFDSMQEVENYALQMLASQKRPRTSLEDDSANLFGLLGLESDPVSVTRHSVAPSAGAPPQLAHDLAHVQQPPHVPAHDPFLH